jgi:hypothetical protein
MGGVNVAIEVGSISWWCSWARNASGSQKLTSHARSSASPSGFGRLGNGFPGVPSVPTMHRATRQILSRADAILTPLLNGMHTSLKPAIGGIAGRILRRVVILQKQPGSASTSCRPGSRALTCRLSPRSRSGGNRRIPVVQTNFRGAVRPFACCRRRLAHGRNHGCDELLDINRSTFSTKRSPKRLLGLEVVVRSLDRDQVSIAESRPCPF